MPSSSSRSATRSTTVWVSCTSSATAGRDAGAGTRTGARARRLPPGPVEAPIESSPRERALALGGDLVEQLLLELQHALRAAEQPHPGLGRLDAAAGAVEQLRAEALLERPHLERHGRLRDAEPLGGLREAPPFDDRAERGELARVHKRILSQDRRPMRSADRPGRGTIRSAHEGLDRHDELAARAVLSAADRAARGTRARRHACRRATSPRRSSCSTAAGDRHDVVGPPHGGAGRAGQGAARWARACARSAPGPGRRRFDLALSHASHELPLAARSLRVPSAYAYDYEFARAQHTLGSRAATRVVAPEAIPQERLDRLGAHAAKVRRYPGLKEEYYLAGLLTRRTVLEALGLDPARGARRRAHAARGLALPPPRQPAVRGRARAARQRPRRPGGRAPAHRRPARALREAALPSLVVPEHAIDAQSLIALADLVVSAGGTMNREAVALGTPVWTTFAGTMGAVDEGLIADGTAAPS